MSCVACAGTGHVDRQPVYTVPVDPHLAAPIDFAGQVLWPCPTCTDLEPAVPFVGGPPDAALIDYALHGTFDDLGVHVAELRLQRGLDRFERITRTGYYAPVVADLPQVVPEAA